MTYIYLKINFNIASTVNFMISWNIWCQRCTLQILCWSGTFILQYFLNTQDNKSLNRQNQDFMYFIRLIIFTTVRGWLRLYSVVANFFIHFPIENWHLSPITLDVSMSTLQLKNEPWGKQTNHHLLCPTVKTVMTV